MSGLFTTRGKNTAVAANKTAATHAALFDPDGVEMNDDGDLLREAITWGTETDGVVQLTGVPYDFTVPAGFSVAEIRYMEGSSGANYQGSDFVRDGEGELSPEPYPNGGVFQLTAGSLSIQDPVVV